MGQLDDMLGRYRRGELSWDAFYRHANQRIHSMLNRPFRIKRIEHDEIASEFYPRFVRLSREYEAQGASFEAYLFTALRYFIRSRGRSQQRASQQREILFACTDPDELYAAEAVPPLEKDRAPVPILNVGSRGRDALRRQLIMSLCKNMPLLSDAELSRYAERLDLPEQWIRCVQAYVHDTMRQVSAERTRFREQRDRHFMAIRTLEHAGEDKLVFPSRSRVPVEQRLRFHKRRWRYYAERLARQNAHLSNRQIATLLGIPKGSVDSGLNSLGQRLARLSGRGLPSSHDHAPSGLKQSAQTLGV